MDITAEVKKLRAIMPRAVITVQPTEKHIAYICDLRHRSLTDKEHEALFEPIKNLFGDRLMERYSSSTGHFTIYVRHEANTKIKMIPDKISAIRHLENCFNSDPRYKKDWMDYIEIIVTEELEEHKIEMSLEKLDKLRTSIANHILRTMFDSDWWEAQI